MPGEIKNFSLSDDEGIDCQVIQEKGEIKIFYCLKKNYNCKIEPVYVKIAQRTNFITNK